MKKWEDCKSLDDALDNESKDILYKLMTNKYANYYVKLFVAKSSDAHKRKMLDMVFGDLLQINQVFVKSAMNTIGTHCLQSFIEQMKSPDLIKRMIDLLLQTKSDNKSQILLLVRNQNGCHVLKKVLQVISPIDLRKDVSESSVEFLEFLNNILAEAGFL